MPDPEPAPGQVVVKVGRCGICGSDLHMTEDAAYGCKSGDVLGHEFAGEIVGVGSKVAAGGAGALKNGDFVSVIPLASSGPARPAARARSHGARSSASRAAAMPNMR